jgi:hypothetical protein
VLLGVLVLGVALFAIASGGTPAHPVRGPDVHRDAAGSHTAQKGAGTATGHSVSVTKKAQGTPAIEAGVLPWALSAGVSREIVLPGKGTDVTILGGLASSQASVASVLSLDTATGQETALTNLAAPVHDASGALIGGDAIVFGGGSPDTVATVQEVPLPGSVPASPASARHTSTTVTTTSGSSAPAVVGQLPQPRSDSQAATIGRVTFIVGGYDGSAPDPEVLSTNDGRHFAVAAKLPVPVRYPAVGAIGGNLYLFGGQLVGGPRSGQSTDVIQELLPAIQSARVVGHLQQPLAGAVAVVLGGHLYVAGGVSATSSSTSAPALASIWAFDPVHRTVLNAGTLPVPVSYAAATVVGQRAWIVGGENAGTVLSSVEMMTPNPAFGTVGTAGAGSPFYGGKLLIADRGNNRFVLLNSQDQIVWTYPSAGRPPPPGGFYFPDDAFFAKNGTEIITNQEENESIVILSFPQGKVLWRYGHPHQPGSSPGYLHEPDDAYLLKNGQVTVADADNCRVLVINPDGAIASQIGTTNNCVHQPPSSVGSPNGDTPLADGNLLISEINGSWVSEYTPAGKLVWTVQLPIAYPSDPQQVGPDLYLVSDYSDPGGFIEFNRAGTVLYRYQPAAGAGRMNHPSLTEALPSGVFMSNDDYRHRVVAVDPVTQALVWQYGVTDHPGTAPGSLNTPDGFDLVMNNGTQPLHPVTG